MHAGREIRRPKIVSASQSEAAQKLDLARAAEYETQSRIALAGYEACHELADCMLAAALGRGTAARIMAAGAGRCGRGARPRGSATFCCGVDAH
jgi:hypothetical protein